MIKKRRIKKNVDDQLEYGTLGKATVGEKSENLYFFTSAHKDLEEGDILLLKTKDSILTAKVVESVYDIHEEKHIDAALVILYYEDNTQVYLPQNTFKKVKHQEVKITKGQKVRTHGATSGETEGTIVRTNYKKFVKDYKRAKNIILLDLPKVAPGDSGSDIVTNDHGSEVSVGIFAGCIRQRDYYAIPINDARKYFENKIEESLLDIELINDSSYINFNHKEAAACASTTQTTNSQEPLPSTEIDCLTTESDFHDDEDICQDLPTTVLEYVPIPSNEIDCVTTDSHDTTSNVSDEDRQHPDSPNTMLDLIDFKLNL
eukprot:GHVU01213482.1.p1 GENE.GHVU01213482.1~~GHVU01213482.1.p1  ORF type:complete len:317 (+),score=37.15 GHVU01213482.1:145-1095(+)